MAIINYTDQLKFAGKGYLDAKMMPVATIDELYQIPRTQRFEGLTITVLNNGNPQDYYLVGGTSDANWTLKESRMVKDLEERVVSLTERIDSLAISDAENTEAIEENTQNINKNADDIRTLFDRVNALSEVTGGYEPDEKTIELTGDESKKLSVKILNKEGNMLREETNDANETGLYAGIPIFLEDGELN